MSERERSRRDDGGRADRDARRTAPGDAPWCPALLRRTYTDSFDGFGDMDFTDYGVFATCDYCGWDSSCFLTESEAQRARWRHPDILCWLRALWLDSRLHPARLRLKVRS